MENKKEMKMEVRKELLIGIILISIISLIFLASALTSELEIELSNLVSELESGDYGWLVDYNVDYPSVEVYEENSSLKIADFGIINEDKKYQVYLDGSSGAGLGNKTQNIFDLKILGGSVEFDYIVDPIILGNANSVNTNTTYENNFTHLNVSNSSIVAYFPFDDNASATTVYDYTNNSNDGTIVGGAVYNVSGWVGGAYTFDAVNDVINVTYPFGGLNTATTGTWSAWVNTAEGSVFLSFGKSDINHQIMMQVIALNVLRGLAVDSAQVVQWDLRTTSGIGQNNTWVHVAMTHNGTEPILYVNGVAVAQSFSTSTDKTIWLNDFSTLNKMTIGANAITPQAFFKGSVDEVMIWNTALTSTEVLAIYNNQTARFHGTGEMNYTGVNFAGNDTINITLAGCQQNMGTSLRAKVNDGAYVNFSSGCTIQDYNATGNLNSANVTIGFVSDANKFYTPLVIGNITLDSRDLIAPNLTINIPTNNSFSSQTNLSINYTAQSNDLSACWYSNDTYTANTTLANCGNITTVQWAEGQHNVTIWVNDTANSVNSSMVTFTIDTTFPTISYDPQTPADNSTINSNSIYVNVSVADANFENMSYSLYNESLNISGLVGYWNFDRNTTTIRDLSKQGNDGTRSGGVNWTTGGKLGNGYSFDGVNDAINLSNNILTNNLATTTKGTWSAWIKPVDATPTASSYIIQFGDTDANERIIMFATTTGLLDAFLVDAGVNQWGLDTDAVAFSDNTWTHVALVQDGTSPVIYVNGVAIAQAFYITTDKTKWFSATTGIDNGRIGNGVYNNLNTGYFTGNIDEPMIFNRALSSAEVSELYNRQLVNYTTYSTITPSINWTSLSENDYHYFTDVIDKAENYNFTQIRWVELDTTFPTLSFANPTTNTSNLSQDFILANVSFTETNINITNITLYNSTQNIINSTTGTTSPVYINFSGLSDGTYYLNATISDTAGNKNQTETRTIILDMINPSLNITFPNNNSFSSVTNLSINYTRSDALSGLSTCWYSNDTYTANTTLANCGNITTVQWAEGQHNLTIWVNDSANNVNSSRVTFTIDTTFPTISYDPQTPADNSTINSNSIYVNVSVADSNFENMSYSLYNESLNTSDLVGYWNFDRNTTKVRDLSKQGNDGTRNGGVNWTTGGKLGEGFSFDGVDDYISINSVLTNNLATTTTGTWSAWVKPVDATPTTSMEIVGFTQEAVLGDRIEFYINSTGHLQAEATFSGPKYWALSTDASAVSDNTWTHLAIVQNGTSPVFYVNGIVPAQSFTVTANKTYWFNNLVLNRGRIGDRINGNPIAEGLFFNGTIDEVMIFNKSLSAADISELYNRQLVNYTTYSTITPSINWTSLSENDYHYFTDVLDDAENYNFTQIRWVELDTTFPVPVFANPTTNTSNLSQNFIQANVSVTEINLNTINISLFNSTQNIINSTTGTTSPVYINFSGLSDGRYYLNATVNDTAGNKNYTGTRIIGLDRVAPNLTINSPTATTYTISTILFNATSIDATTLVDSCWYTTNSGATNRTLSKDGTTNFYNFTASGFADAGYTARFYCNDTANNINNTQNVTFTVNTFVPAGGGPAPAVAGGAGAGAPSKPSLKRIFNLEYNMYDQTISLKQVEFDKLGITNNGEVADEYNIEVKTIENIISFEDKKIKLEPEESKEIEFKISSPKEPGIYTGKIIVSNGVSEREVLVTINVKTEKSLFDITLTIPESLKTLLVGQNLISKIDLIQMGLKENIDITLNYVIKDFEGQTYLSESETIAVFDQKSYEKEFFTSELSPGQYILGTELIHPDGVAVASTHFVVQEKGIKFGKEEILLISLILVLIVISLVIFLSIRKYKRVGRVLARSKIRKQLK